MSYLIFLGFLGLAIGSFGLRMSCCNGETSTSSVMSSSLNLGSLGDTGRTNVLWECVPSPLPDKGPSSVPTGGWYTASISVGGSVTSNRQGCGDPSNSLVQGGEGAGVPLLRTRCGVHGEIPVFRHRRVGIHTIPSIPHHSFDSRIAIVLCVGSQSISG